MEIVKDLSGFRPEKGLALAIGKFDGVHRGHQKILREVVARKAYGEIPAVFTFEPGPQAYFARKRGIEPLGDLTTATEKERILASLGIELLIEYPFNEETRVMPAEDFVEKLLVGQLNVRWIAAGPDVSFGEGGSGNASLLEQMQEKLGYQVELIDKELYKGHEISSTLIREYLHDGEMEKASDCLGVPYGITGTVVHGHAIGRTVHIPTINILPEPEKLLPPFGVYSSLCEVDGETYYGITNIGRKPTISDKEALTMETHLFDYEGNLYGRTLTVRLLHFCRPERHFPSFDALREQMEHDLEEVKSHCSAHREANEKKA